MTIWIAYNRQSDPASYVRILPAISWMLICLVAQGFCGELSAQTSAVNSPEAQENVARPLARVAPDFSTRSRRANVIRDSDDDELDWLLRPTSGVTVKPVYYGEVFTNTKGGISTNDATQYEGLLDIPVTLDFESMGLPLPGRFFMLAQNTQGRGLTEEFVGDFQTLSNIDSFDNIMQVSEYWWEAGLFDQKLRVRLGKQDINTEFLVMNLALDFINGSFGLSPSAGLPSYPNPSMAAVMLAQVTPDLQFKFGAWDALSSGGNWGLSGNSIRYYVGELEYVYELNDGRLIGRIDLGVTYVHGGSAFGLEFPDGRGFYIQLEQMLFREHPNRKRDRQGLGAFISTFPRFPTGKPPIPVIFDDVVAGMIYRGPIPCRDNDVFGAGFAWTELSEGGTGEETAFEIFYKAQISTRMSLQPDIQYIRTPSGIHRDALAIGCRFQLEF